MAYKEVEALSEDELYNYDFSRHGILFRERLVELRKEKGYTQQALADLLGISVWTLNSYEAKGVLPRFDMIIMLCKALGCTADYLLGIADGDFLETGFNQYDKISYQDFVDVIRALNEREHLDFYVDKDKNGNKAITFQVTDPVLTTHLAYIINLMGMKSMLKEPNFELVYRDLLWEKGNTSLVTGKKMTDEEMTWHKKHYSVVSDDELNDW